MFFSVRGHAVHIKCNECDEYFCVENFWPPKSNTLVECPECKATAEWHWETGHSTEPELFLKWTALEGNERNG